MSAAPKTTLEELAALAGDAGIGVDDLREFKESDCDDLTKEFNRAAAPGSAGAGAVSCRSGTGECDRTEGTIAFRIREGRWWRPRRRAVTTCATGLRAAQLRLLLGFLHSERLTESCWLELETGRITETIASCFRVRVARLSPSRHLSDRVPTFYCRC